MNNYVICSANRDRSNLRYLSMADQSYYWSSNIKDALIMDQQKALSVFDSIRTEKESRMITASNGLVSYDAPLTLRRAAGIYNKKSSADIRIGVCSIELHSCADELWHVQDGMNNTYKIEEND